jgi:two-component system, NarL family, invasion response regulator UvrY
MSITIALVDDHTMLRNGLAEMLNRRGYPVLFEASNGLECIEKIDEANLPNIILMDINMPEMNGFETTKFISTKYPSIKILAVSMYDNEQSIIKILKSGAKGFLLKDSSTKELINAIEILHLKGVYSNDLLSSKLINAIHQEENIKVHSNFISKISEREMEFLKLSSTELSYKEIAQQMNVSPRTIDGYREALFVKLNIHTRVGLAMFCIKEGIVVL